MRVRDPTRQSPPLVNDRRCTIRLPGRLVARLEAIAKRQNVSLNMLLNQILEHETPVITTTVGVPTP